MNTVHVFTATQIIPFGTEGPTVFAAFDNIGHYDAIVPCVTPPVLSHPAEIPPLPGVASEPAKQTKGTMSTQPIDSAKSAFKKPTSWFPHATDLLNAGVDILRIQETCLTANGQRIA
jgi:hypothetical protein